MDLNGIAAIVTGGASGLGGATAEMLAVGGAKVTIFDLNEEVGAATAERIGGLFVKTNVTDEEGAAASLDRAESAHSVARILATAANASQMTDAASALLVVSAHALKDHGLTPIARVHTLVVTAGDPVVMLEEPIPATARVLQRAGLRLECIDLFEVNEAFASVPLAWLKVTGADPAKLNVNGGAIALGHSLGAAGTKLMATLIHALRARGGHYGLQTMCEGGGVANATIVELL